MKPIASMLSFAVASAALTFGAVASADPPAQRTAPATTTTTRTADYTEQNLGGDQVVKFTGDELVGPPGSYYGTSIRPAPGVTRVGLIRPRMNFVAELLKSVENL
jgi:hypothetical protein